MDVNVLNLCLLGVAVCCRGVSAEAKPYQCFPGYPPGECHLTNMGLLCLPEQLPPNTTKLHAEDNMIKELKYGAIQNLPFLIEIYLENNLIPEVTRFMFYGATGLEHINLAHCVINHISIEAFCETPKLSYLDLQYNYLEELRSGIFTCLKSLRKLLLNNMSGLNYNDSFDESKSRCGCPARAKFHIFQVRQPDRSTNRTPPNIQACAVNWKHQYKYIVN